MMPNTPRLCLIALALLCLYIPPPAVVAEDAKADQADDQLNVPTTKLGLELVPRVLVFTEPVREDGTIDYIAALNTKYSEGVTQDNNAFRDLFVMFDRWNEDAGRWQDESGQLEGVMQALDLKVEDLKRGSHLVDWYDYALEQGIDEDKVWEVQDAHQFGPFEQGDAKVLGQWIKKNEPLLEKAIAALDKPRYWSPAVASGDDAWLLTVMLPSLGQHRSLARAMNAWVYYLVDQGEYDKAVGVIRAIRRLAWHQSQDVSLIAGLVGISIDALAVELVKNLLDRQALPAEALLKLQGDWQTREGRRPIVEQIVEGERLMALDAYINLVAGNQDDQPEFAHLAKALKQGKIDLNRGLRSLSFRYRNLGTIMKVPAHAGRYQLLQAYEENFEREVADLRGKFVVEVDGVLLPNPLFLLMDTDERTDALTSVFATIIMPALTAASNTETRIDAKLRATLAAVAIERYRLKQGKVPASLDALVPAYFDAVPKDPYTDKPLIYKPTDKGFKLYSVGENLIDDGGKLEWEDHDHGDIREWGIHVVYE